MTSHPAWRNQRDTRSRHFAALVALVDILAGEPDLDEIRRPVLRENTPGQLACPAGIGLDECVALQVVVVAGGHGHVDRGILVLDTPLTQPFDEQWKLVETGLGAGLLAK